MKVTKTDLKKIVKECLVEILSEGIGSSLPTLNESNNKKDFNFIRQNKAKLKNQHSVALKEAIKLEAGGNQLMEAIFADTASNSLSTMVESDIPGKFNPAPIGSAEKIVATYSPQDIFGEETSSKWESLAFNNSLKK